MGDLGNYGPQLGPIKNPPHRGFALHDCILWHFPGRSGSGNGHQRGDPYPPPLLDALQAGEDHGSDTLVVFQGLATGSLLYVVFFEIMEKERKRVVSGLLQVRSVDPMRLSGSCANWPQFCGIIAHT